MKFHRVLILSEIGILPEFSNLGLYFVVCDFRRIAQTRKIGVCRDSICMCERYAPRASVVVNVSKFCQKVLFGRTRVHAVSQSRAVGIMGAYAPVRKF